jgi:hypothetical protein
MGSDLGVFWEAFALISRAFWINAKGAKILKMLVQSLREAPFNK